MLDTGLDEGVNRRGITESRNLFSTNTGRLNLDEFTNFVVGLLLEIFDRLDVNCGGYLGYYILRPLIEAMHVRAVSQTPECF